MSASQQKKLRKDQQTEGIEPRSPLEQQELVAKKRRKIITSTICIILAVLIVVAILFNTIFFTTRSLRSRSTVRPILPQNLTITIGQATTPSVILTALISVTCWIPANRWIANSILMT